MAELHEDNLAAEAFKDVMQMLEVEPTAPASAASLQPDIPALREQLAVLVSTGKSKEAIGAQLTHEQVKRLTDKDVVKYSKRYQAYVGAKTTETLIDSVLTLFSKAIGMFVNIKDVDAYRAELRQDYIINKELSDLSGSAALKCGRLLAVADVALITAKHIDFSQEEKQPVVEETAE